MAKQKLNIPVRRGKRLELTVESLASSGDGISRYEGYTLFVPTGAPGDCVVGEVVKTTPRFGVTRVVETLRPAPNRVEPPCPVFPQCGGCKLQNLPYEKQLEFKKQVVIDDLTRIGKLELPETIQTIPSAQPYHYRNKASFAVQKRSGATLQIGFFRQGTHDVEDSDRCDTLVEPINAVKEVVRKLLTNYRISIFNEIRHAGFLRGLIVRHSVATRETLVGLVTTKGSFPAAFIEEMAKKMQVAGFPLQGIVQNINVQKTNIILGGCNQVLWGRGHIIEKLGDIKFHLSLSSFFQVNPWQTVELYDLIKEWVGPNPGRVIDAYCGIGGISLWLANHRVTGIEESPSAVEDAVKSARLNNMKSCQFLTGPVEDHIQSLAKHGGSSTLILDPPRKGCSKAVIQAILDDLNPKTIIYISCNPATLARDLNKLCEKTYALTDLRVVDMFPQTQHIETAVLLKPVRNRNPTDQQKA